jgi:hypothetical protein
MKASIRTKCDGRLRRLSIMRVSLLVLKKECKWGQTRGFPMESSYGPMSTLLEKLKNSAGTYLHSQINLFRLLTPFIESNQSYGHAHFIYGCSRPQNTAPCILARTASTVKYPSFSQQHSVGYWKSPYEPSVPYRHHCIIIIATDRLRIYRLQSMEVRPVS